MAQMLKTLDTDAAIKIFEVLAKDDYSPIWWVIDGFEVNGHTVSVGQSTQNHQVIIDGAYVDLKGTCKTYKDGFAKEYPVMEYIRLLLDEPI